MKRSKACDDKMCAHVNEDATRDRNFKGETKREECDDEEEHNFLLLLKRRNGLTACEAD